jgi:hypothetical protein
VYGRLVRVASVAGVPDPQPASRSSATSILRQIDRTLGPPLR